MGLCADTVTQLFCRNVCARRVKNIGTAQTVLDKGWISDRLIC